MLQPAEALLTVGDKLADLLLGKITPETPKKRHDLNNEPIIHYHYIQFPAIPKFWGSLISSSSTQTFFFPGSDFNSLS